MPCALCFVDFQASTVAMIFLKFSYPNLQHYIVVSLTGGEAPSHPPFSMLFLSVSNPRPLHTGIIPCLQTSLHYLYLILIGHKTSDWMFCSRTVTLTSSFSLFLQSQLHMLFLSQSPAVKVEKSPSPVIQKSVQHHDHWLTQVHPCTNSGSQVFSLQTSNQRPLMLHFHHHHQSQVCRGQSLFVGTASMVFYFLLGSKHQSLLLLFRIN